MFDRDGEQPSRAPVCRLDHVTLLAPNLAAGRAHVLELLGVDVDTGGAHPRMGTHNLLLRLGDSIFLEVLAIDPDAPPLTRPRWFGLDHLSRDFEPFLGAWVVQTTDIEALMSSSTEALGQAERISRGELTWTMSVATDGHRPLEGTAPAVIQWGSDKHPAQGMQDQGCRLIGLDIHHPSPERIAALLGSIGYQASVQPVSVAKAPSPQLIALVQTPSGLRTLF